MIKLIENGRKFDEEDIYEMKEFLSKLPYSHLKSTCRIERIAIINGAYADSSPFGSGLEMRISDDFYHLNKKERAFTFLHEVGHNYFDFRDEEEGKRSILRYGPCKKKDVFHLLRVQWMELGEMEIKFKNMGDCKEKLYKNSTRY